MLCSMHCSLQVKRGWVATNQSQGGEPTSLPSQLRDSIQSYFLPHIHPNATTRRSPPDGSHVMTEGHDIFSKATALLTLSPCATSPVATPARLTTMAVSRGRRATSMLEQLDTQVHRTPFGPLLVVNEVNHPGVPSDHPTHGSRRRNQDRTAYAGPSEDSPCRYPSLTYQLAGEAVDEFLFLSSSHGSSTDHLHNSLATAHLTPHQEELYAAVSP